MRVRHRIPSVFSLYMVDVLCCALGCVVLLWQLYHYESEEQAAKARAFNQAVESLSIDVANLKDEIVSANKREVQLKVELDDTRGDRDKFEKLALVRKNEYDQLRKNHFLVEAMLANERSEHKSLKQKSKLTASELADNLRAHAEVLAKMATVEKRLSALEKELAIKQGDLVASIKRLEDQDNLLKTSDERTKKIEKMLQELRLQGKDYLSKLSAAELRARLLAQELEIGKKDYRNLETRLQDLLSDQDSLSKRMLVSAKDLDGSKLALVAIQGERDNLKGKLMLSIKELADARLLVGALQGDKMSLLKQNQAIKTAIDNRFAGITLTGAKVVFMVDMSGSMELIDDKTFDPDKWPLVCETVGRLMKSLPDLKEYQVILFSDKVRYPLANEGRWLTYHPDHSPKALVTALKAMKPKNETNLYVAFEEAFTFRDQGMDAIYIFSDGLPNAGPGLPPNGTTLSDSEQGIYRSKHLRTKMKEWNRPLNDQRVKVNAIGFFFESPDLGAFLWALAREHDGSFVGMSRP